MTLYLRSRRTWFVAIAMVAAGLVVRLAGGVLVPVPNLTGGPAYGTVLRLLAPAPLVGILAQGLTNHRVAGELVAVRFVRLMDAGWLAGCIGCFTAAAALPGQGDAPGVVRNLVGFTGLMLLAERYLPDGLAGAAPTAYALVGATLGQARDPLWWAWFLRPGDDLTALVLSGLVMVVGLWVHVRGL